MTIEEFRAVQPGELLVFDTRDYSRAGFDGVFVRWLRVASVNSDEIRMFSRYDDNGDGLDGRSAFHWDNHWDVDTRVWKARDYLANNYVACPHCGRKIEDESDFHILNEFGFVCRSCAAALRHEIELRGYIRTTDDCTRIVRSLQNCVPIGVNRRICVECALNGRHFDTDYVTGRPISRHLSVSFCDDEGRYLTTSRDNVGRTFAGRRVSACRECGTLFLERSDENDRFHDLCPGCVRRHARDCVGTYHSFNRSEYRPHVAHGEHADKVRLFGVELEFGQPPDTKGIIPITEEMQDRQNLWHYEQDGSVRDVKGAELITMPCSLLFHQECFGWNRICQKLMDAGFVSHDLGPNKCGLHIHVNRTSFTKESIMKIDQMLNRHTKFFSVLARRGPNHYCSTDMGKAPNFSARLAMQTAATDRYEALNLMNRNTIEFRLFRGSLSPTTVLGDIEIVDGLCEFVGSAPLDWFVHSNWNPKFTRSIEEYVRWMFENRKTHPHGCVELIRFADGIAKAGYAHVAKDIRARS